VGYLPIVLLRKLAIYCNYLWYILRATNFMYQGYNTRKNRKAHCTSYSTLLLYNTYSYLLPYRWDIIIIFHFTSSRIDGCRGLVLKLNSYVPSKKYKAVPSLIIIIRVFRTGMSYIRMGQNGDRKYHITPSS